MALPSSSVVLATIPTGTKCETRISLDEHGGKRFVNIRTWYRDRAGNWQPTRRGATVDLRDLPALAEAVSKAIEKAGKL